MSEITSTVLHPRAGPKKAGIRLAIDDIRDGLLSLHIWPMLGWQEIRQRYRRSIIGPFWLTLSTAIMVLAMGPLYGKLFNQELSVYFLHLTLGLVAWQLIAQTINDSCMTFIAAESFIKQVRLPLSIYVLRVAWRNLIIFFHNLVFVALVLLYFRPPIWPSVLQLPVSLLLFFVNAIWVGIAVGLICARFRDIPLIVSNLVQVAFFVTPVIWQRHMLGRHSWVMELNPFHHFIEMIRAPLMGTPIGESTWIAMGVMTLLGYAFTVVLYGRFRSRIAYWV